MGNYGWTDYAITAMRELRDNTTVALQEKSKELEAKGIRYTVHVIHGTFTASSRRT
jgi:hypothetical protein